VALQGLFNWLSKIPNGHILGEGFISLPQSEWTWRRLGQLTEEHLYRHGYGEKMRIWAATLANKMGFRSLDVSPGPVAKNPWYFCFFPLGHELALEILKQGLLDDGDSRISFNELGTIARRWLFDRSLYKVKPTEESIARV